MVGAAALRYPPKFMADGSSTVSLCTFDFIDFSTKGFSTKRVNKISSTKPIGAIAKVAFQEAGTPFFAPSSPMFSLFFATILLKHLNPEPTFLISYFLQTLSFNCCYSVVC